jgi:hypothetical protein
MMYNIARDGTNTMRCGRPLSSVAALVREQRLNMRTTRQNRERRRSETSSHLHNLV